MNTRQTERLLRTEIYQRAAVKGYGLRLPRPLADLLCVIYRTTLEEVGFPETPEDDTVPTIPLMLTLGLGSWRTLFLEWTLRRWPGKPVTDDDLR
jgi:hypothetical protein